MKKQYPVIDADSATSDYNNKFIKFQDVLNRFQQPVSKPEVKVDNNEQTLDGYLLAQGQPTYFSRKMALASGLGMQNYSGTLDQDRALAQALQIKDKQKAESDKTTFDQSIKNKEFGLKDKEISLQERQMEQIKVPTSDEIANSLLDKLKE